MAEDDGALDSERGQQSVRIRRKLLETVLIALRLGRFAEADLIGSDNAVAVLRKRLDGGFPRRGAEILAVQKHHSVAVRLIRLHVHIGHVHRLALRGERVFTDRIGIVEARQLGVFRLRHRARGHRNRYDCGQ